ncbi:MAG TPA: MoxR family ATPase [Thermoanaerobaculia bacterium]|nr:MoxR family ATPase [Thermoanaerobaculia bacterium]
MTALEKAAPREAISRIADLQKNVEKVIRGKAEIIRFAIAAMLARGHLLLEDVPGVGKTTLAHALARSVSLDFQRIQFTSDLLPADIIGVTIYNQELREFEFISGPIFTNVLLADEINRATPKSQSALLEAMSEGTVTIEKRALPLPVPFLVIATQNPIEHVGTYPLPESQLDRFLMRLTLGYPSAKDERDILRMGGSHDVLEHLEPVMSQAELIELQKLVGEVHMSESLVDYIMTIVQTTRTHPDVELGVSTRGSLVFFRAAQALALVSGRDFVAPDDVKTLAGPILSHRIILRDRRGSRDGGSAEGAFIHRLLNEIRVPR